MYLKSQMFEFLPRMGRRGVTDLDLLWRCCNPDINFNYLLRFSFTSCFFKYLCLIQSQLLSSHRDTIAVIFTIATAKSVAPHGIEDT